MTPRNSSASLPKLSVRTIGDLLSAVPYLLGFHPTESIVVVGFDGKRLTFAVRVDLPGADTDPPDRDALAAHIASVLSRQDIDAVTVIGYGPDRSVAPAVASVSAALDRSGLKVLDLLRVADGRYWSYVCDDPGCCSPDGNPYDPTSSEIAAAATYAGQVALPDRAALVRRVAPVEGASRASMRTAADRADRRLAALVGSTPHGDRRRVLREAGETAVRESLARYRVGGRLTDDEVAWLSLLLVHVPVRDYAWERIGIEDWQIELWSDVVRRASPDLVAAPASLLAFAAWRTGQGALASVALERARAAVPDYSMALLLEEVLRNGIPPAWFDDWPSPAVGPGLDAEPDAKP